MCKKTHYFFNIILLCINTINQDNRNENEKMKAKNLTIYLI